MNLSSTKHINSIKACIYRAAANAKGLVVSNLNFNWRTVRATTYPADAGRFWLDRLDPCVRSERTSRIIIYINATNASSCSPPRFLQCTSCNWTQCLPLIWSHKSSRSSFVSATIETHANGRSSVPHITQMPAERMSKLHGQGEHNYVPSEQHC